VSDVEESFAIRFVFLMLGAVGLAILVVLVNEVAKANGWAAESVGVMRVSLGLFPPVLMYYAAKLFVSAPLMPERTELGQDILEGGMVSAMGLSVLSTQLPDGAGLSRFKLTVGVVFLFFGVLLAVSKPAGEVIEARLGLEEVL
jgi:hypothetical protein